MDKLEIRVANKNDAVHIALLGRITFTESFAHLFKDKKDLQNYYAYTFSVEKIENSITKPNNTYWLAFVDRLPVGYAKLKQNAPSEFIRSKSVGQLQKIYVMKDFLSMRIGFELQNLLLEQARKDHCTAIWLSVLQQNKRAIDFYHKNGFRQIGNHCFQIGKENFEFIAMSKFLS